ncbi:MAG TPA: hypothetical protein P5044_09050, partial [bacterium]|nr:hypothetical protein [bacterium]
MKRLLAMFLVFGLVILLTSCEKDKKPENDVDSNDIDIVDVDDDADDDNGNTGDIDVDEGDTGGCPLDTTWMTPEDSWTLWGYL